MKWYHPLFSLIFTFLFAAAISLLTLGEAPVDTGFSWYWSAGSFFSWWGVLSRIQRGKPHHQSSEDYGTSLFIGAVFGPLMGPVAIVILLCSVNSSTEP